ncbi:hypothetical protein N9R04_06625 [Staphylococcus sp. SQ8-PEA]|uniref:Staphylococcal protein n=1 Tax=Staphylococcus marylandisciuri TaxID=2981529 RepID=A0ABT2QR09_9STAP|nr:hypothetical protein [Staphylococcus marylandisciuri]MCU5746390.1 hypothetical protein [Staphylococcus marylandisciuri]
MQIGIFIFVMTVLISIGQALLDKDHKDRDTSEPTQHEQTNEEDGDKVEEQMSEAKDLNQPNSQQGSPKERTRPEKMNNDSPQPSTISPINPEQQSSEASKLKQRQREKDKEKRLELEREMYERVDGIRAVLDREKEMKLERLEKKAQAIITDSTLSIHTKRIRLKQLYQAKNQPHLNDDKIFAYDEDAVINGLIWSEILNKPKQLN